MKKQIKKRALLLVTLLIAVIGATYVFQENFCHPGNFFDEDRLTFFHNEPEDSMDIVVMGSSDVYAGYSAATAYRDFGITSYPYALSGATVTSWKGMLEDILETQNPKLIVLEPFGACYDNSVVRERNSQAIKLLDTIPFSAHKIRLAQDLATRVEGTKTIDFLFPFIKYHNTYGAYVRNFKVHREIRKMKTSPLKGVSNVTRISAPAKTYDARQDTRVLELDTDSEKCLREFFDYAKSRGVNIVVARFPQVLAEEGEDQHRSLLRANRVGEIAEEYGYPFINMQYRWDDIGLDTYHDFYNRAHLNIYGQQKVTDYICDYLIKDCGLEVSPKSDNVKSNWEEALRYYKTYVSYTEDCLANDKTEELGDSPDVVRKLKKYMEEHPDIIEGTQQ